MKYLLLVFILTALSCSAQDGGRDDLFASFFEKIKSAFGIRAQAVDDNGLPVFEPRTGALGAKRRRNRSNPAPSAGAVTLSADQYAALYNLALQGQAAAQQSVAAAEPLSPVADTSQVDSGQYAATASPVPFGGTAPVLPVALPATPTTTRPPKASSGSAGSPPLRRKQQ